MNRQQRRLVILVVSLILAIGISEMVGSLWKLSTAIMFAVFLGFACFIKLSIETESRFLGSWLPELESFSEADRLDVLQSAMPRKRYYAFLMVFGLLYFLTIPIIQWVGDHTGRIICSLFVVSELLAVRMVAVWAVRCSIRRALRKRLADDGILICVNCGYDTRDLPEPRCPECGESI